MPIVKVIEVIASSEKSIDDAIRNAVAEASKTIRNIDSVYVKDIKAHVKDGQVTTFGLICKFLSGWINDGATNSFFHHRVTGGSSQKKRDV